MSPEADHNFKKIWGRLEVEKLEKGNYTIEIDNHWTAGKNLTRKYFKISNTVPLGSDRVFAYLLAISGATALFFSIIMGGIYFYKRNEEFDPNKMTW